ncbi:hypothetical protein [Mycobacterium sp. OTB74]|uniref:hypothetical protein n=1 Tax=Mycobacterium sp. OTB74 TaxID=1853452 RepID=UPI0024753CBC|nr:hypothetical protein [Mycobacterium sp. OTB74]MDH6246136.1 hypothetical protein [Mycobacterium sp. OTB74]
MLAVRTALIVAAVVTTGLSGCSKHVEPPVDPASQSQLTASAHTPAAAAPLPAADVLTGVLARLADPSIPVEQKIGLIQYGTVQDRGPVNSFTKALHDNGFDPMNVTATDLAWSASSPGNIVATVTMSSSVTPQKSFTFPMEFSPLRDTWQLSRQTANMLLAFGKPGGPENEAPAPSVPAPPAPAPPPAPVPDGGH